MIGSWLLLLGSIPVAVLFPQPFLALLPYLNGLFAATMFFVGTLIPPQEVRAFRHRVRYVGVGVGFQYLLMPLLGYLVAQGFLQEAFAKGTVLTAIMPGAMASNVITALMGGDLLLSVAMTTVATFLAPLSLLFWFPLLTGESVWVEAAPMAEKALLWVVIPTAAGIGLRSRLSSLPTIYPTLARGIASVTIALIVAGVIAKNLSTLETALVKVGAPMIFLNLSAYAITAFLLRFSPLPRPSRYTIVVEVGMQNAGLGSLLALRFLGPEAALPSAFYTPLCVVTALLLAGWYRHSQRGYN